jgi:hypothetical protein
MKTSSHVIVKPIWGKLGGRPHAEPALNSMFCRAPEFLAARSQFAIAAIRSPSWFAGCTLEPKKDGHRTQGADHFGRRPSFLTICRPAREKTDQLPHLGNDFYDFCPRAGHFLPRRINVDACVRTTNGGSLSMTHARRYIHELTAKRVTCGQPLPSPAI